MRADPSDPHRDALYAAEAAALAEGGRRFRRFSEVESFVLEVMADPWWEERFPDAPVEVEVLRRSRGATFSAAHVSPDGWDAAIWIRDGSWDAVTVVHELAHVASGGRRRHGPAAEPSHGPRFTGALLDLWRRLLGLHAYGALLGALDARGVPYQRDRRPSDPPTGA